ncbi:MAG: biotin/lipoyl-containing protein [Candidatus Muiribacteriota bacterium]
MEKLKVKVNGKVYDVEVEFEGGAPREARPASDKSKTSVTESSTPASNGEGISSPIAGVVKEVKVKKGESVKENQVVAVLEAMKMNTNVVAETSGTVKNIKVNSGDSVTQGQVLIEL